MMVTEEYPTFVTHLECAYTGERYEPDVVHGLSDAGKPLLVRYDLEGLAANADRSDLAASAVTTNVGVLALIDGFAHPCRIARVFDQGGVDVETGSGSSVER